MKQSPYDKAVDILLSRQKGASQELMNRFKNTRPFRQEPVSKKEMQLNYDDMMQRESQLRQQFGDSVVDNYKQQMQSKLGGM